jgi:hypothetical protein
MNSRSVVIAAGSERAPAAITTSVHYRQLLGGNSGSELDVLSIVMRFADIA